MIYKGVGMVFKRKTAAAQLLALAALIAAWPAHDARAQVYKCPDASGRTLIQQLPCTGGTQLDVKPATGGDNPANARAAKRRAAGDANSQAILTAIGKRQPAIGMSEETLRTSMGSPKRVNRGNYGGNTSDQWIYERDEGTWFVYVENGVVGSIQFQDYPNRTRSSKRCPNSLEIRNLETAANSNTVSREEMRARQRRLAEAKACS